MAKSLLVSLTSLIVSLLLAEGALRVFYHSRLDYQIEMSRYGAEIKRPATDRLSHEHTPGARARLMGVDVAINAHGFRDDDYPVAKPAETFRILLLGDSMTFGWGADAACRFGDVLEDRLNDDRLAVGGRNRFEVVNTGVGNYNTRQEVTFFKERGLAFGPDLVVLNYFINDAEPTTTKGSSAVFRYSHLATWLWGRLDNARRMYVTNDTFENYYARLYDDAQPGWQVAREALAELGALKREQGIPLVMTIIPELHVVGPQYGFAAIHARVAGAARDVGLDRILDLAPAFAGESNPPGLWVSPDDAHPNCRAHAVLANGLYDYLRTSDLLR